MLVLRRRAGEAIVFEGGLVVTLLDVAEHRAWLAFSAPSLSHPIAVSALAGAPGTACIGVRSPATVAHQDAITSVTVHAEDPSSTGTVLLVNRGLGESLEFPGLLLEVSSLEQGRTVLTARVAELSEAVGVSVFSVSGTEVKIGIDAPDDVRVYREEVWLAMHAANTGAATTAHSPADLASLTGAPPAPERPGA